MKKARLIVMTMLVIIPLLVSACGPKEVEQTEELGPVLKIGQIGMMSGSMALYGLQQQRGFEMGLEYMSGGEMDAEGRYIIANRPVEVIVKDDEGDPEKAVALALELIEKDGVELIQGPVSLRQCYCADPGCPRE